MEAANEIDREKEKDRAFCGSIKAWIRDLRSEGPLTNPRQVSAKNVARILQIYKLEGCRRLHHENHIPVLVSQDRLDRALEDQHRSQECLRNASDPPFLELGPEPLVYLHGSHRLKAANKFLEPAEKWWIVDLYIDELLTDWSKRAIRETYSNSTNFCDGDIYRYMRQCSLDGESAQERVWLGRLSSSKRRDVLQLQRAAINDRHMRDFRNALDNLIPFVGLWPGLMIGTFHRLLTLRCPEELTSYLELTRATWQHILSDSSLYPFLDAKTVTSLQGRCLFYSSEDLVLVETQLLRREIFPCVRFDDHRTSILRRLSELKYLIPTIHTFLEDTKYIEPCAKIMKSLLPHGFKGSIHQGFVQQHDGRRAWNEHLSEGTYKSRESESDASARWYSYRQLWLFAWRHFPEMIGQAPRMDARRSRVVPSTIQHSWWHDMSSLAKDCGYDEIVDPYPDVDELAARDFLRNVRPSHCYQLTANDIDNGVRHIRTVLADVQRHCVATGTPKVSSDHESCGPDITARCGRPFQQAFLEDKPYLFLQHIYRIYSEDDACPRRHLTTFAVKRATFHAFFGSSPPVPPGPLMESGQELTSFVREQQENVDEQQRDSFAGRPVAPTDGLASLNPAGAYLTGDSSSLAVSHGLSTSSRDPEPSTSSLDVVQSGQNVWDLMHTLVENNRKDVLTVLTPISPYREGRFRIERPNLDATAQLVRVLQIAGQSAEHVYMSQDKTAGPKLMDGASIIRHPDTVRDKVILKVPVGHVDTMKKQFEEGFRNAKRQPEEQALPRPGL